MVSRLNIPRSCHLAGISRLAGCEVDLVGDIVAGGKYCLAGCIGTLRARLQRKKSLLAVLEIRNI